jgi:UDP-N-acetyl-2-amino-2-deoxyglucuronate dehydrogenase
MATMVMYTPVLRHVETAEVAALCDPVPEALERAQAYFPGVPGYLDYAEFLSQAALDAVILATPVDLHCEQVVQAARAGKHVMCEKPMAPTLPECDDMIAACESAGVTLMVGFMKRFDKSMLHAKHLIERGRLGEPFSVVCDWRGQQPRYGGPAGELRTRAFSWRGTLQTGGGVYQDTGSHTTDLARWWLGDIVTVSGELSILDPGREVEDSAVGVYLHEGGRRSVHMLGYSNKLSRETYQIDGSKATLEIAYGPSSFSSADPFQMRLFEQGGSCVQDETRYNDLVLDQELRTAGRYKLELEHFCHCVQTGTPPRTSGLDGRKAIEAINAVYLSAYLGEKVHLPLETTPDLRQMFKEMKARSPRIG